MSFLSIKSNPFDAYKAQWSGVEKRVPQAATRAAAVASSVLVDKVQERSGGYPGFTEEMISGVSPMQDAQGDWRVGLSDESPLAEEARQAEYGSTTEPPQALMRTAEKKARAEAEEIFESTLYSELFGD